MHHTSDVNYNRTESPEGTRACVCQTVSPNPVGYDADWPFAYQPGKTWYLQPLTDVNKRQQMHVATCSTYVEGTLAVYERKRIELLRDVFVFAYERSIAQYRVVSESLGQPDPIRLRYRKELADTITQTVKAGEAPATERLRRRGEALGVPHEDLDAFSETALKVLLGLHEGSVSRYRLQPGEFDRWRARFARS